MKLVCSKNLKEKIDKIFVGSKFITNKRLLKLLSNNDCKKELGELLKENSGYNSEYEIVYSLVFGIELKICKNCNCALSFEKTINGNDFCGFHCSNSNKEKLEQIKKTSEERYGGVGYSSKTLKEKTENTNQKIYGCKNVFQSDKIKAKIKQTSLEKYGTEHPVKSEKIREKTELTNIERYGDKNSLNTPGCREKNILSLHRKSYENMNRWKEYIVPLFTEEEYKGFDNTPYLWKCVKCGGEFEQIIDTTGHVKELSTLPRCWNCYPRVSGYSRLEKEVCSFICSFYKGEVIENDRTQIAPKELDLYMPELKVAIEFNGLYHHSDAFGKEKNSHLEKTILCEEKGIRLIHIFEDEWIFQRESTEAFLKNIFCEDGISFLKYENNNGFLNIDSFQIQNDNPKELKLLLDSTSFETAVVTLDFSKDDKKPWVENGFEAKEIFSPKEYFIFENKRQIENPGKNTLKIKDCGGGVYIKTMPPNMAPAKTNEFIL